MIDAWNYAQTALAAWFLAISLVQTVIALTDFKNPRKTLEWWLGQNAPRAILVAMLIWGGFWT